MMNLHRGVRYTPHAPRRTHSGIAELCKVDAEFTERFLNHNSKFPLRKHYILTTTVGGTPVNAQEKVSALIMAVLSGKEPEEMDADVAYEALLPPPGGYYKGPTEPTSIVIFSRPVSSSRTERGAGFAER